MKYERVDRFSVFIRKYNDMDLRDRNCWIVLDTLCLFKQISADSFKDYEYSEIEEAKQYKSIKAYEDPDIRYYACVVDKNRAGAKPKLLFKLNYLINLISILKYSLKFYNIY